MRAGGRGSAHQIIPITMGKPTPKARMYHRDSQSDSATRETAVMCSAICSVSTEVDVSWRTTVVIIDILTSHSPCL